MKSLFRFLFSLRWAALVLLGGAAVVAAGYYYYVQSAAAGATSFRTEAVVRKTLTATISATGTIEPEEVVDIGSQVTGQIKNFGVDPTDSTKRIDFCTPVKQGAVLAEIDPTIYQAQVAERQAALKNAQATLKQAQAQAESAQDTLERDLRTPAATTEQQVVLDRAAYRSTDAQVAVAEAGVALAQANLDEAKTTLGYCTITAPVDGVVVDRRVNQGQTVVANLSAASLFLLAKDLSRVQVWASVNEADIGNIRPGEDVTFSVDARPGKTYHGTVAQIRYNASMTQNVVTYTVVVETENPPLAAAETTKVKNAEGQMVSANVVRELLPYLTANVTFHVAERPDALLVPNAALRWKPQLSQVAPDARADYEQSMKKRAAKEAGDAPPPGDAGAPDKKSGKPHDGGAASHGLVWVADGAYVRPIKLQTGLTDGAMTEVVQVHEGQTLDVGTALVTGETAGRSGSSATTNPFAPPPIFRPQQPKKQDQ